MQTAEAKRRGDVVALNNVSMDLYSHKVNVIIGQNGSGKSTLMGLLTGLFPTTAGELQVMGRSSTWNVQGVRELVSVCPQQDVFLDQLTVREHLQLYSDIKGDIDMPNPRLAADGAVVPDQPEGVTPEARQAAEIEGLLTELGMIENQHSLASQLSGG